MSDLHTRVSKAFRVGSDSLRRVYTTGRKAGRFFRDARRRAVLRTLEPGTLSIPADIGFAVFPPRQFAETAAIVAEARAALARFDASNPAPGKNRKRFLVNVLNAATLTHDSPIIQFALRDDVLTAVARYLGVVPFLTTVAVFHSDIVEGAPTSSQLHHCDGDDVTQIKIFVYCTDVDRRSGPLTVVTAAGSARLRKHVGYRFRERLSDAEVHDVLGNSAEHVIVGPSGTTAFVDTSRCFHYGSRVTPDAPARLVTMIQYQTPYSFMLPAAAQDALPFRHLLDPALGPLQRLVLGE